MTQRPEFSMEELRARIAAAGVPIPEAGLEMVRRLLSNALAPIRAEDWRAASTLEPAVTFDAGGPSGAAGSQVDATAERRAREAIGPAAASLDGELPYAGIRELGRRFRRREGSPAELTPALLERLARLQPKLRAVVTRTPARPLADAQA